MKKMKRNNRGFSLIEVLITLILVSIGILGMVAMQGKAIAYTQDSVQRNNAAMLAEDLMELIRTNQIELIRANQTDTPYLKAAGKAFPAAASSCTSTPSKQSEQVGCWATKAGALLPGASNLLTSDFVVELLPMSKLGASIGTMVQITLVWSEKHDECQDSESSEDEPDNVPGKCTYTLRAEL